LGWPSKWTTSLIISSFFRPVNKSFNVECWHKQLVRWSNKCLPQSTRILLGHPLFGHSLDRFIHSVMHQLAVEVHAFHAIPINLVDFAISAVECARRWKRRFRRITMK
jgi:hypothetical protein